MTPGLSFPSSPTSARPSAAQCLAHPWFLVSRLSQAGLAHREGRDQPGQGKHRGIPHLTRGFVIWALQKSVPAEEAHFINTKQLKFLLARSRWQVMHEEGHAPWVGQEGADCVPGPAVLPSVSVLPELTGWVALRGTCSVPRRREHDRALAPGSGGRSLQPLGTRSGLTASQKAASVWLTSPVPRTPSAP